MRKDNDNMRLCGTDPFSIICGYAGLTPFLFFSFLAARRWRPENSWWKRRPQAVGQLARFVREPISILLAGRLSQPPPGFGPLSHWPPGRGFERLRKWKSLRRCAGRFGAR